jgi:DNA-binding response OmpR family regulator
MHDTTVIIMTGRPEDDCLEMMATRWVDGWLFKPFGLKELRNLLQRLGLLKDRYLTRAQPIPATEYWHTTLQRRENGT